MSTTRFAATALAVLLPVTVALAQQPAPLSGRPGPALPPATGQSPDTPQAPADTFRVEINYVEIDAIVTDRTGTIVRGLTRDDFELLEDGKPQKIELFSFVNIPVEPAARPVFSPTSIEPDVKTNERPFEGRMYVIALDDLHTDPGRSPLVVRAAKLFIERSLGANDLAAVVYLSGRSDGQEFTNSKRLLSGAVDRFIGGGLRSPTLNRIDDYNRQRERQTSDQQQDPRTVKLNDIDDLQRGYYARMSLDALKKLAEYMAGIRGRRKAIVLFSEGIDYDIYDVFNNRDAMTVLESVRQAIGAATRAGVSFYGVDPRGLSSVGAEDMELTPVENTNLGLDSRGLQNDLRLQQDSLRVLSDETGGFASVSSNDFASAFDRIVRDNSTYYVLGYYPTDARRDGRFRKVEVRVKRPDLEVRARKGYVAPQGSSKQTQAPDGAGPTGAIRALIDGPLPASGLPMGVHAAAFKGAAPNASVLVTTQFAGRQFKFTEKDGQLHDALDFAAVALDSRGKLHGSAPQRIDVTLPARRREAVERAGIRLLTRLELPPGRYQLRVAGRAVNSGAPGAVHYDLEVPDFFAQPLSMSGIALTSVAARLTPTARQDEQLKDVLPAPTTVARDFVTADTLALFVEVYDNEVGTPHKVDITTTVLADDGRVASKLDEQRSSDELKGARGGYGYTAQIPLTELAPGGYVLRVEATSRLSGAGKAVGRDLRFRVVPTPAVPPSPTSRQTPATGTGTSLVPVARGPRSEVESYKEVVVRTEEEWTKLWASLAPNRPAPKVNFASTMVAGVFLGSRPSAGYSVDIVSVARDGDALVIGYAERAPAPGVMAAQMMTTPFALAGVPMHTGPVRFEKVQR